MIRCGTSLRPLAVWVLLALLGLVGEHARAEGSVVAICSREPAPAQESFIAELNQVLTGSGLTARAGCEGGGELAATLQDRPQAVVLQLSATRPPGRERTIPWLTTADGGLARTSQEHKVAAFALLLESLARDFESVTLRDLPSLEVSPPAPTARASQWGLRFLAVGAGLSWLGAWAPRVQVDAAAGGPRWQIQGRATLETDSTLQIGGRALDTRSYGLAMGAQRAWLLHPGLRADAGLTVVGRRFQASRADLAGATPHTWYDLGLGASGRLSQRLAGAFGLWLGAVLDVYPGARTLQISGGPQIQSSRVSMGLLGGLALVL